MSIHDGTELQGLKNKIEELEEKIMDAHWIIVKLLKEPEGDDKRFVLRLIEKWRKDNDELIKMRCSRKW